MSSQLLLFAEPLLRDGLARLLTAQGSLYTAVESPQQLKGLPQLVIWQVNSPINPPLLAQELQSLQERSAGTPTAAPTDWPWAGQRSSAATPRSWGIGGSQSPGIA